MVIANQMVCVSPLRIESGKVDVSGNLECSRLKSHARITLPSILRRAAKLESPSLMQILFEGHKGSTYRELRSMGVDSDINVS